jgi:hypothetical protein
MRIRGAFPALAEGSYCFLIENSIVSRSIGMILRGDSNVDFGQGEVYCNDTV